MNENTSEKLRKLLKDACEESNLIRELHEDPRSIAERYDLSDAERERLENSDVLMVLVGRSPAGSGQSPATTTTPITITDC
ncbi:hypothetical protein DEJ50_32810 [Streptomyces venezuelae]|uniref:Extradiol ring-cleavage dioxygenase LigAB LigA subunit domain-containing protein n=1 Tax=Streptomyces venezuelae TaxID=54571 RepID=A0A5P2D9T1_STRVZ|nr:hypothetical protein [Streptomyces venezuelae]QES51914.1 hypothetical protein DEJ50_32810 [Streptomyces venezuelae]